MATANVEPTWRKQARRFLSGAVSSTLSAVLLQPLDVIKTSQQAAVPASRLGVIRTAQHLVQTQGFGAAWKGTGATTMRVFFGAGFYFMALHGLLDAFQRVGWTSSSSSGGSSSHSSSGLASFVAGAAGRSIAAVLMSPVAVVKTRIEASPRGAQGYTSTLSAIRTILRTEGGASLYSGVLPTIVRDAPFSGVYYAVYSRLKELAVQPDAPVSVAAVPLPVRTFAAGVAAGAVATILTHPADVIKTRLQLKSAGGKFVDGRILVGELLSLLQREGPRALLVGVTARILKRALSTALTWTLFEEAMRRTGLSSGSGSGGGAG